MPKVVIFLLSVYHEYHISHRIWILWYKYSIRFWIVHIWCQMFEYSDIQKCLRVRSVLLYIILILWALLSVMLVLSLMLTISLLMSMLLFMSLMITLMLSMLFGCQCCEHGIFMSLGIFVTWMWYVFSLMWTMSLLMSMLFSMSVLRLFLLVSALSSSAFSFVRLCELWNWWCAYSARHSLFLFLGGGILSFCMLY